MTILSLVVIISTFGMLACTDYYNDLNTPPHELTEENVDTGIMGKAFAKTQYKGMFGEAYYFQQAENLFADLYVQYFTTTAESFDSDQYDIIPGWAGTAWNDFYGNTAPELEFVLNYTSENGMEVHNAIAKIWKVQLYHRITDYWGPIIYSEFNNGETKVPYDSQESIYKDFFQTLDEAVGVLEQNTGNSAFAASDLIYEGNVNQWLKFANSLRLRLAMRVSYVEPALAQTEAEKAINATGGLIINNEDNANVKTNSLSRQPYGTITQWHEFRASAAMTSALNGYQDPRREHYLDESENGGYYGARNGLPKTDKGTFLNPNYSYMDSKWMSLEGEGTNPDIRVMNAAEIYFLLAEGALRGWNMNGTAEEFYDDGIRASLTEVSDATSQEINSYINSSDTPAAMDDPVNNYDSPPVFNVPVDFQTGAGFETKLEQIISQKWLALYPDGWEIWAERRRTNYPDLYPIIESLNPDIPRNEFPQRVVFVPGERQNNTSAVEEAINNLLDGPDNGATKVWWDTKPEATVN